MKQQWDKDQCVNISKVIGLDYDNEVFKFCRRVGPAGQGPRPLVIGLYTDMERSMLLRRATRLEGTDYSEVKMAPDLTKRQRKEERDLWEELESRKAARTPDQVQKNLVWAVVGSRGEKRLLLQPERQGHFQARGRARGRGRQTAGGQSRPPQHQGVTRGRGRPTRAAAPPTEEVALDLEGTQEEGAETAVTAQLTGALKRRADGGPTGQPPEK